MPLSPTFLTPPHSRRNSTSRLLRMAREKQLDKAEFDKVLGFLDPVHAHDLRAFKKLLRGLCQDEKTRLCQIKRDRLLASRTDLGSTFACYQVLFRDGRRKQNDLQWKEFDKFVQETRINNSHRALITVSSLWGEDLVCHYRFVHRGDWWCDKLRAAAKRVPAWEVAVAMLNGSIVRRLKSADGRTKGHTGHLIELVDLKSVKDGQATDRAEPPPGYGWDRYGLIVPEEFAIPSRTEEQARPSSSAGALTPLPSPSQKSRLPSHLSQPSTVSQHPPSPSRQSTARSTSPSRTPPLPMPSPSQTPPSQSIQPSTLPQYPLSPWTRLSQPSTATSTPSQPFTSPSQPLCPLPKSSILSSSGPTRLASPSRGLRAARSSIHLLREGQKLDDLLINSYLHDLVATCSRTCLMNSHFLNRFGNGMHNWRPDAGTHPRESDVTLMPVHDNHHWCLLVMFTQAFASNGVPHSDQDSWYACVLATL